MPELRKRTITGYCDPLAVRPGDTVRFMTCCYEAGDYQARLVRLLGGDDAPGGIGVREEPIDAPCNGDYPGTYQPIHRGSHGTVPAAALGELTSFTLQAMIQPTLPGAARQAVMGRWREAEDAGFALILEADGSLGLLLGDGQGQGAAVSTGVPLRRGQWTFVAAGYDGASGALRLVQRPLTVAAGDRAISRGAERLETLAPAITPGAVDAPFLFAAWHDDPMGGHFNGRIDRPRLASRMLTNEEMAALEAAAIPGHLADAVVGAWDFSQHISDQRIADLSANQLHGRLVNLPTRAVTGHNWTGEEHCWRHAPDQYGAIHFHQDDLYDAGWRPAFSYTVPDDLPSGVYAASLRHGDDVDRIPFFVLPPKGRASAGAALLLPTATYMSYANTRQRLRPSLLFGDGAPEWVNDGFLASHPEVGHSHYDPHDDRSGVHYSSRLRPVLNMKPGDNRPWGLPVDLNIVAWLDQIDQPVDIITDEDLHAEGEALLRPYRCVLTGSHPEYYSTAMLDAVDGYLSGGGRLMYLGGNGFYWRIAFHDDLPGVIEVRRAEDGTRAWMAEPGEYYHSFNGEYGGLWRRIGRPPNRLVGVGFAAQGFEDGSHYRRHAGADDPRAAFALAGIGEEPIGDFGSVGGAAAGEEIDRWDSRVGTPPHTLVLARADEFGPDMLRTKEDFLSTMPWFDDPNVRADMVFFECPNGGAVFSTGSIAWVSSLAHQGYDNNVARITSNVLRRFLDPEPFPDPAGLPPTG